MTNAILRGKPDAGNPHVRFDEGEVASAKPRRGSLLYMNAALSGICRTLAICLISLVASAAEVPWVFEGNTNRVAASNMGGSVPNLVRSEFSEMLSLPAELQVKMGHVIILR